MATVLIIEDDAEIRNVYSFALEKSGYTVLRAGSGPEGLALIDQHQPDAVLLDMLMPGMSGLDMLKAGKLHQRYPNMKVAAFSNIETPRVVDEAKALGVATYMLKVNVTPHQMVETIQKLFHT